MDAPEPTETATTGRGTSLLNTSLVASLAGILISSFFGIQAQPPDAVALVILGSLFAMLGVVYLTARSGRLRAASWLFCVGLWAAVTVSVFLYGGIRSPITGGYFVVVLLSGFLLGGSAPLLLGGLSALAGLAILWSESAGYVRDALIMDSPLSAWGILAAILTSAVLIIRFYDSSLRDALAIALEHGESLQTRSRDQEAAATQLTELNERLVSEIAQRERADSALRESEERLRSVMESSTDYIMQLDLDARIVFINRTVPDLTIDQVMGKPIYDFVPERFRAVMEKCHQDVLTTSQPGRHEVEYLSPNGETSYFESRVGPVILNGEVVGLTVTSSDVTERRRTEEALARSERELQHAKKMEAIGMLAGGVAHDFNNILTVIHGYSELLLARGHHSKADTEAIEQIDRAAERAASLTQQLLAFSRRQVLQPRVLDLGSLVGDMQDMLSRIIGEDVELVSEKTESLGYVKADPGEMHQVILNLVVNARDAMPDGGTVTIRAQNVEFPADALSPDSGPPPGSYVLIEVRDNGIGMDPKTLDHIFDPFFTTKDLGRGTGLGLSTVYGIVKQSGGFIYAEGEPDKGSTFRMYLPAVDEEAVETEVESPASVRGAETILLVEDDDAVRALTREVLIEQGYRVLEADNGRAALSTAEANPGTIDLLVTDVVMPELDGPKLADRLLAQYPGLRVLFVSGYSDEAIWSRRRLDAGAHLLRKPFTPASLTQKVREVLEMPTSGAGSDE